MLHVLIIPAVLELPSRRGATSPKRDLRGGQGQAPPWLQIRLQPRLLLFPYLYSAASFLRRSSLRSCSRSLGGEGQQGAGGREDPGSLQQPLSSQAVGTGPGSVPLLRSWPRPPSWSCAHTGLSAWWECAGSPGTQTPSWEEGGENCGGWGPSARSHGLGLKARRPGRAWAGWTSSVRWAGPQQPSSAMT